MQNLARLQGRDFQPQRGKSDDALARTRSVVETVIGLTFTIGQFVHDTPTNKIGRLHAL